MQIYTGNTYGKKLDKLRQYEMGIVIASTAVDTFKPTKEYRDFPCAIDNGAFMCYQKGYPFMEGPFLNQLEYCYKIGIPLDFVVCPDIVCGGKKSLDFSLKWSERLIGIPNLALVIQDGMTETNLNSVDLSPFTYIFIGGSPEWKWENAESWVSYAHSKGKKCHIGQVGKLDCLRVARDFGADSVDSTSFTRNDSWHILDEYYDNTQMLMDIK